jgi:hypothetical protein
MTWHPSKRVAIFLLVPFLHLGSYVVDQWVVSSYSKACSLFRESVRSRQSGAPNSTSLSTATRMTNSSTEKIDGSSVNLVFTVKFDNIVAHAVWPSEFIKRLSL